jgi:protocatechuate 3,4-dioxygenase beta subunit
MSRIMLISRCLLIAVWITGLKMPLAAAGNVATSSCLTTPRQTEGPYYPPDEQRRAMPDRDNDLTIIAHHTGSAQGQLIHLDGRVLDSTCRPLTGAFVEIWQASANGRYFHPRDVRNPSPLDPNFQYWGQATTDKDGRFVFRTVKPGSYQAGRGWTRPPHIHLKVDAPDRPSFITQLYFSGDPFQEADLILKGVPAAERPRVILRPDVPDDSGPSMHYRVDLVLPAVG